MRTTSIYWQMFTTFLKVGAFTLGGGYAMIPIIEEEVVKKRQWVKEEDFLGSCRRSADLPGCVRHQSQYVRGL